jgi:hypothetical protein
MEGHTKKAFSRLCRKHGPRTKATANKVGIRIMVDAGLDWEGRKNPAWTLALQRAIGTKDMGLKIITEQEEDVTEEEDL